MCVCLQHVGPNAINIRNYQIACCSPTGNGKLGTVIYVHNRISYEILTPSIDQYQVTSLRLCLPDNRMLTICNIYNQPDFSSDFQDLSQLSEIFLSLF